MKTSDKELLKDKQEQNLSTKTFSSVDHDRNT